MQKMNRNCIKIHQKDLVQKDVKTRKKFDLGME